ncbi:MAG TPA: lamin tail domain-containing protein, partial [Bacteroidia bacterium]|nr:lamin tail domain-containing protein [Bacteroidia bacterium]
MNGVYLGYRFSNTLKFQRISMFDNGLHNDGASGDNVFGATFTMTASQAQYYVYAENNNAGKFAPERAEHEFYNLIAIQTATLGQVKINEFLADNQGDVQNEFNQYEDWIELHNTTSTPLELSGLFLTDNFASPFKFTIPQNTIIQPNGYLIIWADENPSTA